MIGLTRLAADRYQRGINRYREGDPTRDFEGDPLVEAMDECADLWNYVNRAEKDEVLEELEAKQLRTHAHQAYRILDRAVRRRGGEHA